MDEKLPTPVHQEVNASPHCAALGCTERKPHGHLASGAAMCGEKLETYCGFERGHDGRHAWDTSLEYDSHADLLAACKALLKVAVCDHPVLHCEDPRTAGYRCCFKAGQQARAAIAKAEAASNE